MSPDIDLPWARTPLQPPVARARRDRRPGGLMVRMYRQGLGDRFLLAFPTADPANATTC